jgi:hypothetical protein
VAHSGAALTDQLGLLREAIRRPLPLAYHPLYRFYEGGSLTRMFRGLPGRPGVSIAVVVSGAGLIEGDFGRVPVRRGETYALPASLAFRLRAGPEPVSAVRCLGPVVS